MRILRAIGLSAALLGGCAPATVQLARTNGQGNFQFGIEPGVIGAAGGGSTAFVPSFNVAGRYGVSDQFDVGARLGTSLYELQFKYMFTDPAATDTMAIAVAPSTTLFAAGVEGVNGFYWNTRVPLLLGLPVGDGSEFTFGPSGNLVVGGGGGAGAVGLLVGGQVGFAAKVADNFRLVPQLDLSYPVIAAAAAAGESSVGVGGNGLLFGFQLGLLLGGPE